MRDMNTCNFNAIPPHSQKNSCSRHSIFSRGTVRTCLSVASKLPSAHNDEQTKHEKSFNSALSSVRGKRQLKLAKVESYQGPTKAHP